MGLLGRGGPVPRGRARSLEADFLRLCDTHARAHAGGVVVLVFLASLPPRPPRWIARWACSDEAGLVSNSVARGGPPAAAACCAPAHARPQARTHVGGPVVCGLGDGAGCRMHSGGGAQARRHGGASRGMGPRAANAGQGLACPSSVHCSKSQQRIAPPRAPVTISPSVDENDAASSGASGPCACVRPREGRGSARRTAVHTTDQGGSLSDPSDFLVLTTGTARVLSFTTLRSIGNGALCHEQLALEMERSGAMSPSASSSQMITRRSSWPPTVTMCLTPASSRRLPAAPLPAVRMLTAFGSACGKHSSTLRPAKTQQPECATQTLGQVRDQKKQFEYLPPGGQPGRSARRPRPRCGSPARRGARRSARKEGKNGGAVSGWVARSRGVGAGDSF